METILNIKHNDKDHALEIMLTKSMDSMPLLAHAFVSIAEENIFFRAVICSAFTMLCKDHPKLFDHLDKELDKEPKQTAFQVTPNPTKS